MKKHKKVIAVITSALAVTALTISATAYFSNTDKAINKTSIGKNDISITESGFSTPDSVSPGDSIVKEPVVKVTGTDCYVRIFCEFSDSNVNYANLDFNTTDWTEKQPDGYYYYKHKLSDGEETKPLFTRVKISDSATDTELDNAFDIIIYSESAQAYDSYNHTEFANYQAAWAFWKQRKGADT